MNPDQRLATVLRSDEGSTGVALAGVLAGVHGAEHQVGDAVASVDVATGLLAGDGDVDFVEDGGLVASTAESSPAGDSGQLALIGLAPALGQTRRAHCRAEGHWLGQPQDGVVAVGGLGVVVGVLDDLGDVHSGEGVVADDVLSKKNPHAGCGLSVSAVGGGEDVLGGDQGTAAEGSPTKGTDKPDL